MTRRASHLFLLIFLALLGSAVFIDDKTINTNSPCFLTVPVNVSGIKPPIVSGPSFPPRARFEGITLNEIVNGSPRHVLVGFFNFELSNWTEKRPRCYFKALEGFSENWTGLIIPGVSSSNITLSGRVYLAVYVYPKETSIIISKVKYGEKPEESKVVKAFHLRYHKSPDECIEDYLGSLEEFGYIRVKALPNGILFKKGHNVLLVLETKDEANFYVLVAMGSKENLLRIIGQGEHP